MNKLFIFTLVALLSVTPSTTYAKGFHPFRGIFKVATVPFRAVGRVTFGESPRHAQKRTMNLTSGCDCQSGGDCSCSGGCNCSSAPAQFGSFNYQSHASITSGSCANGSCSR